MIVFGLYKDSEVFRRSYSLFIKLGASDPRLDSIREELKNVDYYYNKIKEYERLGYLIDYRYYQKTTDYRENYPYAKYIITQYLNANSYNFHDFLEDYGLTETTFNICLETLKELDVDLFNQYQEKHQINENILLMHNIEIFKDIYLGITTGYLKDGTEFNRVEFSITKNSFLTGIVYDGDTETGLTVVFEILSPVTMLGIRNVNHNQVLKIQALFQTGDILTVCTTPKHKSITLQREAEKLDYLVNIAPGSGFPMIYPGENIIEVLLDGGTASSINVTGSYETLSGGI